MSARFLRFVVCWLGLAPTLPASSAAVPAANTVSELKRNLAASLAATQLSGAHWGVEAVSLSTGKTLFATNANQLFVPASNTKLFTAALALDRLGADHRLATALQVRELPDTNGTLRGDLAVVGGGDPTFTARLHGGKWEAALLPFISAVKAAGIRRIAGDLVCDESAFRGPPYGGGWNWDDLGEKYAPAVSALSFNDNTVNVVVHAGRMSGDILQAQTEPAFVAASLRPDEAPLVLLRNRAKTVSATNSPALNIVRLPGSTELEIEGQLPAAGEAVTEEMSVPEPARYFGAALREAMQKNGIAVSGRVRVLTARDQAETPGDYSAWHNLATLPSPALGELVRETLKPSQNLYAQLLLLAVGAETERYPRDRELAWSPAITTEAAGLRALGVLLGEAGIARGEALFQEGSGLSRGNLVTPDALVRLLIFMNRHRWAQAWRDALPVGGVDGTLKSRFTGAPTKGNVRAKTGTLSGVCALSGYLTTAAGEPIAFSILVNNFGPGSAAEARRETDALAELLAAFSGRGE
jgi:serine-type D-Ala-D-Ala carboxypeptidase/endopeptidase (penicillin-binding protein 4)